METVCFACGAKPKRISEKSIFDSPPSGIYECPECRLLWRFPLPSKESIDRVYSAYDKDFRFSDDIQKRLAESQRDFIIKSMSTHHTRSGYRFIEFGAGHGWLVKIMSESSFVDDSLGVDPIEKFAEAAKQRLKVNMVTGFIDQFELNQNDASKPTLIAVSHLMEHLPDPIQTLRHLKEEFPRHLLFIEVPDGDIENEMIMNDVYFPTAFDQHLVGFSMKSLQFILEHEGYSVINSERVGKDNFWEVSKISNKLIRDHMDVYDEWKTRAKGPGVRNLLSYSKLFFMTCRLCASALRAKLSKMDRLAYPSIRVLASYQK